jgi:HK97 family phage major capsid protein
MGEVETIKAQLDRLETLEGEERSLDQSRGRMTRDSWTRGTSSNADSLRSWLQGNGDKAFTFHMAPDALRAGEELRSWENRNQSTVTGPAGGHTIARELHTELERALRAYGGARQASRVLRTSTGAQLDWPSINETSKEGPPYRRA